MYQFNRFYLIFSLIFSYTVPFISIETELPKQANRAQTVLEATQQILDLTPKQENVNWMNLVWIIYAIVTLFFLIKIIISIVKIKNLKGEKIIYQNHNVVLTKENLSPFSFWKTIYLGRNYLINNKIDSRIFLHEKSHLEQRHSIDLLFIEILKIFTWFNPAIYFYKKAIVTNHEFLADEFVLKNDFNVKDYQNLILDEIISSQNYNLTHTFNFNNTKKRFIMMSTKKSKLTNVKKVISIPILIAAFGLFVQKTYANNIEHAIKATQNKFSEPERKSTAESIGENIRQIKTIPTEEAITEKLPLKTNAEEKVLDTIRPKSNQNVNTTPETSQNRNTNISENDNTILPQFPGGMNELRTKISKTFDGGKINASKNKEMYRANISYTVTENGTVADIKVSGDNELFNNETLLSFKRANENITWKPAEKNGKPIPYTLRIPLTMSFQ
ncbi:M56 family metallopeptidase [Chryseobacterium ginsenosidimutans]|uniref:M56 family metallopeptidase n=1 Tax=Chryseobacterium ginsenosidimutans TaxID=687846 RepID=UPI0027BAFC65|nr:M56 family metallopeptidase [Chryseobacterium ginsenosidimutans]